MHTNRDLTYYISMPDKDASMNPSEYNLCDQLVSTKECMMWMDAMNYEIFLLYGSFVYMIWSTQTLSWFTDLVPWYFFNPISKFVYCRKLFQHRYPSMAARRNVRYSPLPSEDGDDSNFIKEDVDLRYTYTPKSYRRIPWKSIALALFLLLLGTSLLFLSYFIFTGHMEGDSSQAYGLLFLGFLSFLPGMLI